MILLGNRYQVIRSLNSGGFGDTYLAEDQHSPAKRRCVVKRLRPMNNEPQIYQMVKERFGREAAILEDLGRHGQIPALYAYFEENGLFYLVEEWVEGPTLTEVVAREGVQSESTVKELLASLLLVLDYVHSQRIVHRDVKPDNIILRAGDRAPVLIDFGAVKEAMGSTITPSGNSTHSIVVGTPGFMPSEQSAGRPVFASDLFSLGLTAIFLLAGKIPQELTNDPATGEIRWRQYAPMVSPTLGNFLDKAIQMHPRDRYATASEMLAALQSSWASSGVMSPTVTSMPTTLVSSPPTQPTTVVGTPPATPPPTPINRGTLSEWQKAIITGSVVGIFVVLAIVLTQLPGLFASNNEDGETQSAPSTEVAESPAESSGSNGGASNDPQSNDPPTSSSETPTMTNSPPVIDPPPSPSPTTVTQEPYQPPPQETISQEEAVKLIQSWQNYKRRLFAPPYDRSQGSQLLTGTAYSENIRRSDGGESSVDWLEANNARYTYGVQRIDKVEKVVGNSNFATAIVVLTEQLTLYKNGKPSSGENSGLFVRRVKYSLQRDGGRWKIEKYEPTTLSHE